MTITINMQDYPIDVSSDNDVLVTTTANGDTVRGGRISGYSAGELIDPTLKADGFLEWYDPTYAVMGTVFVQPEKKVLFSVPDVNTIGLFKEQETSRYVADTLLAAPNTVYDDHYVALMGYVDSSTTPNEGFTETGVTLTTTNAHQSHSIRNAFFPNNAAFYLMEGGDYLQVNFPGVITIDGCYITTLNTYSNNSVILEYSTDGINWLRFGELDAPYPSGGPTFSAEDIELGSNPEKGLTVFEKPLVVKHLRIIAPPQYSNLQPITYVNFFSSIRNQTSTEIFNYDVPSLDLNALSIDTAGTTVKIHSDVSAGQGSIDLSSSKTLEKQICLKDSQALFTGHNKYIPFTEADNFIDDIHATMPYTESAGGITLEAGLYEFEVELEAFINDYRQADKFPSMIDYHPSSVMAIRMAAAIRNIPLTDWVTFKAMPFVPNLELMTYTHNGHAPTGPERLYDHNAVSNTTSVYSSNSIDMDGEFTVTVDHVAPLKMEGIFTSKGKAQDPFEYYKVEISADGETFETTQDWTHSSDDFQNVVHYFDSVKNVKTFKVSYRSTMPGSDPISRYTSVGRLFGIYDEITRPKNYSKAIFRVSLSETTTVGFEIFSSWKQLTVGSRRLKINKLENLFSFRDAQILHDEQLDWMTDLEKQMWDSSKYVTAATIVENETSYQQINLRAASGSQRADFLNDDDYFTVAVKTPTIFHRVGTGSDESAYTKLKMESIGDKVVDVSDLSYAPISKYPSTLTMFPNLENSCSIIGTSTPASGNESNLFDGKDSTHWLSAYDGGGLFYIVVEFDEPITANGMFETLNTVHPTTNYLSGGPRRVVLQTPTDETNTDWVEVLNDTYDDHGETAMINEQYKMSLDGTARSGASNFSNTGKHVSDGKRRFYGFKEPVTSKVWRFGIQGVTSKRKITANEYGLFFDPGGTDYSDVKSDTEISELVYQPLPFTKVVPPGIYRFSYNGADRRDSVWFAESVTEKVLFEFKDYAVVSDESRIDILFDGDDETSWYSDSSDGTAVEVFIEFDQEETVEGIYETLSSTWDYSGSFHSGGAKDAILYRETAPDTWELVGSVSGEDVPSIDGSTRVGATTDDGSRTYGDDIRRYYKFPSTKGKRFRLDISHGVDRRRLVAREYGLFGTMDKPEAKKLNLNYKPLPSGGY